MVQASHRSDGGGRRDRSRSVKMAWLRSIFIGSVVCLFTALFVTLCFEYVEHHFR
jgi:hypothetical protein